MTTPNISARFKSAAAKLFAAGLLFFLSSYSTVVADSATWKVRPFNVDWNTATNWRPMIVPNGPNDTATFHFSKITDISIAHSHNPLDDTLTQVKGIIFETGIDGASAYTITLGHPFELSIGSGGIVNTSGLTQTFVTETEPNFDLPSQVTFNQGAITGDLTVFMNNSPPVRLPGGAKKGLHGGTVFNFGSDAGNGTFVNTTGGATIFNSGSSAGNGTFINSNGGGTIFEGNGVTAANGAFTNEGGEVSGAVGGTATFEGASTAGGATFTVDGGMVNGARGGLVGFFKGSCHTCTPPTAGNATFIVNGAAARNASGGLVEFFNRSNAGNATLIANGSSFVGGGGGSIVFGGHSKGGTPRVEVFGNGTLFIAVAVTSQVSGVTIGSIEGTGVVLLANHEVLTVGSNNLSTVFSGVIQDGGIGGALAKIGTGTLTLAGANTYTGGTTINDGALLVNNASGSGTGTAVVEVKAGRLGGAGTIDAPVMVGSGSGAGAVLSPGNATSSVGTLTTQKKLTFNSDATYECDLNSSTAAADKVFAHRVTINAGAQISFADLGSGTLAPGTVFTIIENDTPGKIEGTFANLPDGSTFTSGSNTFRATYEGGDGNDLTLTVQ